MLGDPLRDRPPWFQLAEDNLSIGRLELFDWTPLRRVLGSAMVAAIVWFKVA